MGIADIIGFTAALICSLAMIPQVVKIYRTKETRDLSLGIFAVIRVIRGNSGDITLNYLQKY